jgi:alpha-ketoglutarate-dependent taurine dioxygenase
MTKNKGVGVSVLDKRFTRLNPHFGVITHDDFRTFDRDTVVNLLATEKLVIFRGHTGTPTEVVAFADMLGPAWAADDDGMIGNYERNLHHPDNKKITLVRNARDGVLGNREVSWHNDVAHRPWYREGGTCPVRILYADVVPNAPTPTMWCDQEWLYDNCPLELRNKIEHKNAKYVAPYETTWEIHHRPLVITNPITGRKALSVGILFFLGLEGYSASDFFALKTQLLKIATSPENVITHQWQRGDLVINNNYSIAHHRPGFVTEEDRILWRLTFQVPELIPKFI